MQDDFTALDEPIKDSITDLLDTSLSFKPYYRSTYVVSNSFISNHAGRKGSAVFVKGVSYVLFQSSKFTLNKAVDVLEERLFVPPYAIFFLGVNRT
jgi:hypothetical protein